MSGMESFLEKQAKLLEVQPAEVPQKDHQQVPRDYVDSLLDTAIVAQEPNNSDPGEWQDLCFHKEEKSTETQGRWTL